MQEVFSLLKKIQSILDTLYEPNNYCYQIQEVLRKVFALVDFMLHHYKNYLTLFWDWFDKIIKIYYKGESAFWVSRYASWIIKKWGSFVV